MVVKICRESEFLGVGKKGGNMRNSTLKNMNLSAEHLKIMAIRVALQKMRYGSLKNRSEAVRILRRDATPERILSIIRQYHLERDQIFCLKIFWQSVSWEYSVSLENSFARALINIVRSDMQVSVRKEAARTLGLVLSKECRELLVRRGHLPVDKGVPRR